MESIEVLIYVDPQCPFAWIASEWLSEVERAGLPVSVRRELMSLACVNEGRELDEWYAAYNAESWAAARLAAALLAGPDAQRWPDLYATFGRRRHVAGLRDNTRNLELTVAELGLPAGLLTAAGDAGLDADLRRRTALATADLPDGGGTPSLHVAGRVFFGPVLTAVPRGEDAVRLWEAVHTLATTSAFSEIKGVRAEELHTG